jgi:hypothetical protein
VPLPSPDCPAPWPVALDAPVGIQTPLQPQVAPVISLLALLLLEAVFPLCRLAAILNGCCEGWVSLRLEV